MDGAQGVFDLVACTKEDTSDAKQLIGTPAGSLTWDGKEIERVELKGSNYIRYSSGLTLMWGIVYLGAGVNVKTVNLPIPFNSAYSVLLTSQGDGKHDYDFTQGFRVFPLSLSSFEIDHTWKYNTAWHYLAIGY